MSTQFTTPVVTEMQVIPVAGHDSMLMNLSGAHAPFTYRKLKNQSIPLSTPYAT
ncbi:hypothetical protein AAHF18_001087 [Salmonella enterica]